MSIRNILRDIKNNPKLKRFFGAIILAAGITIFIYLITQFIRDLKTRDDVTRTTQVHTEELKELLRIRNELRESQARVSEIISDVKTSKSTPTSTPAPPVKSSPLLYIDYSQGKSAFNEIWNQREPAYIPAGAVFQAKLITPIKTSVQRSFVLAEVTKTFRMDPERQIRQGSRLLGGARLNPVLKGVIVDFTLLVDPAGKEHNIDALALSRNALPELEGLHFSNELENYSAALAFGFISGLSEAAQERDYTVFGPRPRITVENQLLHGLSTASFQVAEELIRDVRERAIEYVVIPAGENIFVALQRRYEIDPRIESKENE